jgi:hypothetical protein
MQENPDDGPEFTEDQLRAALERVGRNARQTAFAAGRPVFFLRGRTVVALHPDGTEEVVETVPEGSNGETST